MTTADLTAPTVVRPSRRLRVLLLLNGISNFAGGVPLLIFAGTLAAPTGLPPAVITSVAVFYLVYGGGMWLAATRPRPRAVVIAALIAVNPVWALCCLTLLAAGPATLGTIALVAEAVAVTALAAAEWAAYRRSPERETSRQVGSGPR